MPSRIDQFDIQNFMRLFEQLAIEAGRIILSMRNQGVQASIKADCSPVTEADLLAEKAICAGLAEHFPRMPLVAEEASAAGHRPQEIGRQFVLVDPLDGTREFMAGRDEFTVNIALIRDGAPFLGVISAPALHTLYLGRPGLAEKVTLNTDGKQRFREPIKVQESHEPLRILASRSHRTAATDAYLATFPDAEILAVGSSLKFCLLAEGSADLYPRFGPTMQWDTAAGDAILRAAGGKVHMLDGAPLTYGKHQQSPLSDYANPSFIACTQTAVRTNH